MTPDHAPVQLPLLAWHFVGTTLRDGRPIPHDGEVLRHDGPIMPCEAGLHACPRILDAAGYAPGSTLCRVRLSGVAERHFDKVVATERTILWRLPARVVLDRFARETALSVAALWQAPAIVRHYLIGGSPDLRWEAGEAVLLDAQQNKADFRAHAARTAANKVCFGFDAPSRAQATAREAAWALAYPKADSQGFVTNSIMLNDRLTAMVRQAAAQAGITMEDKE